MTTTENNGEYNRVAELNYRVLSTREEKREEIHTMLQTLADQIIDQAIESALERVKSALINSGETMRTTSGGTEGKRKRGRPKKN